MSIKRKTYGIKRASGSRLNARTAKKKVRTRKGALPSISKLIKACDKEWSLIVRQKYADENGNVICFTCPYTNHWKKLQNGHFVSRYYKSTRWEEKNCRPQCYTCNMWRKGMVPDFAANLQKEYGQGIVEELFRQAQQPLKLTREFLQNKLQELTNNTKKI